MSIRFGVGLGPFYASVGTPRLHLTRGLVGLFVASIVLCVWVLKVSILTMVYMCWWSYLGVAWCVTFTAALIRRR